MKIVKRRDREFIYCSSTYDIGIMLALLNYYQRERLLRNKLPDGKIFIVNYPLQITDITSTPAGKCVSLKLNWIKKHLNLATDCSVRTYGWQTDSLLKIDDTQQPKLNNYCRVSVNDNGEIIGILQYDAREMAMGHISVSCPISDVRQAILIIHGAYFKYLHYKQYRYIMSDISCSIPNNLLPDGGYDYRCAKERFEHCQLCCVATSAASMSP